ncbi:MAG TPA: transporter substrate-binding domain-containing protein [Rhodocyclaceae bacterium]|nr:transporter substrate-binding domain-containing protein [Rhodocyclaceae bacterium]
MQSTRTKWFLILLAGAGLAIFLFQSDDSLQQVRQRGVLRIGYAVEAPYAFVGNGGTVLGESPATAELIARQMGITQIEWIQVPFADLIPSLLERRFDLIAAGLFITPERSRQVAFSHPTLRVYPGLLVRKGNPQSIHAYAELAARKNLKVAVLSGSVEQARLLQLGLTDPQTLVMPDAQAGMAAVASGSADVLALSLPTTRWLATSNPQLFDAVGDSGEHTRDVLLDQVAMAFNPRDKTLLAKWDEAADVVIGSTEHLSAINNFGFTAQDVIAPGSDSTKLAGGAR